MALLLQINDLSPLPLEEIEAVAKGDTATALRLAACWGYQLALSDLDKITTSPTAPEA